MANETCGFMSVLNAVQVAGKDSDEGEEGDSRYRGTLRGGEVQWVCLVRHFTLNAPLFVCVIALLTLHCTFCACVAVFFATAYVQQPGRVPGAVRRVLLQPQRDGRVPRPAARARLGDRADARGVGRRVPGAARPVSCTPLTPPQKS